MIYAKYAYEKMNAGIVAVVDISPEKRAAAASAYGIPDDMQFDNADDFYKLGKVADAVIIATMDRDHFRHVMPAIELKYDILLEKPISPDINECLQIRKRAHEYGVKIVVCHVLRYTRFFSTIKKIIDSGEIGKVVTIQHAENVGNFHMAHSFVRGNWRNSDESSPIIMQKSCHDMDILQWLVDSECEMVSSFGGLSYFRKENAPEGSTDRCLDCPVAANCRFDGRKAYMPIRGEWPAVVLTEDQSEEGLREAIRTGPYGQCVFHCDNNVCDHQVSILRFTNGITATFNLSGFTNRMTRTIKIMGEDGEIRASEDANEIEIIRFAGNWKEPAEREIIRPAEATSGHNGGDSGIVEDFLDILEGKMLESATDIHESVESHMMACAAEEARLTGSVVNIAEYRRKHERKPQA